ncbi:hypothetical protein [uncultured Nevskia sp.]|uniref:hypothetical protein n=1 Tax=uncultured Nevskia sp. TaxID=228950 RepID=UPI0025F6EBB3|nr:hypothetical protein [uncultured Nevskia sp.]
MSRILIALLCFAAFSTSALADTCLNTDKEKYADNDPRSSDYGKCKSTGPTDNYGSVTTIGKQMEGMLQRNAPEPRRQFSAEESASIHESDRERFANSQYSILCEVEACVDRPSPYPNANTTPEQQQAVREEIKAAIASGKLLETYGDDSYAKKWLSGGDPVANWKMCEVATTLTKAYVYGNGVTAAQKNPAKGLAIARAGCTANCGGTCLELGRIFAAGDAVAPGVDKILGKTPHEQTVFAFETAIRNGITAAYEPLADLNSGTPARYKGKTYFNLVEMDSYNYWNNSYTDRRLAYRQYQKCLKADPSNLNCARGINLLLKDVTPNRGDVFKLASDVTNEDISFYKDYQQKLEALLATAQSTPTPAP